MFSSSLLVTQRSFCMKVKKAVLVLDSETGKLGLEQVQQMKTKLYEQLQ